MNDEIQTTRWNELFPFDWIPRIGGEVWSSWPQLQIDQAEADKQIAQAEAEERRAMAVALEQEMRARLVESEAESPKAMAKSLEQGNLGVFDYQRLRNVEADTRMRDAIAGDDRSHQGKTTAPSELRRAFRLLLVLSPPTSLESESKLDVLHMKP